MPPKNTSGESKQGLVITIVILVLMVIGLGIGTYYGFALQADITKQKTDAVASEAAKTKSRDWEHFKYLVLKSFMGYATKDELTELGTLWDKYNVNPPQLGAGEADKQAFDDLVRKFTNDLGWNQAQKIPQATLVDKLAELTKSSQDLQTQLDKTQTTDKATMDQLKADLEANRVKESKLVDDLAKAKAETLATQDQKSAAFVQASDTINKLTQENLQKQNEAKTSQEEAAKSVAKVSRERDDLKNTIEKIRPTNITVDYAKTQLPQGRIINLDPSLRFAYINLGSTDNIQPGLSFSVYPAGSNGKAQLYSTNAQGETSLNPPKARVEVVRIVQAHMSECKLYDDRPESVRDANPVQVGDLIYNPAWSPTMQEHIALAGLIDLTGEGRDNTQELIRDLGKQNIVVDEYLDLKDVQIKGPGMNYKTKYLVIGEVPTFDQGTPIQEGNPQADRKREILTKMTDIQTEATQKGIQRIKARDFLAMIGFRMPRSYTQPEFQNRSGVMEGGQGGTATPPATPGAAGGTPGGAGAAPGGAGATPAAGAGTPGGGR